MTTRMFCVVVLAPILLTHTVDLFAQNTVVSWSALDMGLASPASATTKVLSVAGQVIAGPLRFANTMIESGFLADTLLRGSVTTGINEEPPSTLPTEFHLEQNYPNPFNGQTKISFSVPRSTFTTLKIYNTLGQEIATLVSDNLNPGVYSREWNASNAASGVYYYRLQAGGFTQTKKLILLR